MSALINKRAAVVAQSPRQPPGYIQVQLLIPYYAMLLTLILSAV